METSTNGDCTPPAFSAGLVARGSPRRGRLLHGVASAQPPLALPQSSPRHADPDARYHGAFDDRDIFNRFVADERPAGNYSSAAASPAIVFSRTLAQPPACYDLEKSLSSPRAAVPVQPASSLRLSNTRGPRQSPSKTRPLCMLRPHSPVSDVPPETVVTMQMMQQLSPRGTPRKAILSAPDTEKITAWLQSLKRESRSFASYFLYCETLFRESETLLRGKPTPNRLQTAVAFHCLCQATGVFARHEHVLHRICQDLGAAIFLSPLGSPVPGTGSDDAADALEFYAHQLTFYDQQRVLRQQRDDMEKELKVEATKNVARAKEEQLSLAKIRDLEARYKIKSLEQISHRNTANVELKEKLQTVLQSFQYMDEAEKQHVVLGVIDALRAHITSDTVLSILDQISVHEKDKLLRELFQDDIVKLTEKIRSEVIVSSNAQQNAILERSAARITRFQTLIWDRLRTASSPTGSGEEEVPAAAEPMRSLHDDDDLCDQDRKVLESISDVLDDMHTGKQRNAALEEQLREAEATINNLRWKSNAQLNDAQDAAIRHAKELAELRDEFAKAVVATDDKAIQTDRRKSGGPRTSGVNGDGENGDDDDDDDDDASATGTTGAGGRGRRRRGGHGDEDDELIVKNRRLNQFGFGIASLIEQAKIPSSKIRKILAKRKPLTLNELHAIIIGYYQAKMFQDVQDDNAGKMRSNLAQFIMDMYTLHYGLKDLAISQLVFLDASIRKHAAESTRVRTFGLLTGSLDPDSHACSVQGVDFFLFVVLVLFNAGTYKRGRKQSVHVAQNLKSFFGDGLFMSPCSVTLKSDVVATGIDLIFSNTRNELGSSSLERLKGDIRSLCLGHPSGGIDIDVALDKITNHWLTLYEQQIVDIHTMFGLVDTNGDGTLDFCEFCEVVQVLEPDMDRRDALALYNKAAGDDHVMDKNEFVQVMLAHQRGAVLKEFYKGDTTTKKSISTIPRKPTSTAPPSNPLPYKPLGRAQLDREESYASLVAAMGAVTHALGSAEDPDDDSGSDDATTESDYQQSPMRDSVSFMTLGRMSVWASEAKGRLIGTPTKQQPRGTPPTTSGLRTASSPGLAGIPEQTQDSFEKDINELLEQALSKANIDLNDVF